MFRKLAILCTVLCGFTIVGADIAEAAVYFHHPHPKGYYYRGGYWRPYRGYGHPYRGGYYDRWGHWHRF